MSTSAPNSQGEPQAPLPQVEASPQPETSAATSAADRRRHERIAFTKPVWVSELNDRGEPGPSWKCRGVDLSRAGLGLRSRRHVHCGHQVLLEVPGPDGRRALFGVVRQSRYAEGEGYAIGIEFRDLPMNEVVERWIAERGLRR